MRTREQIRTETVTLLAAARRLRESEPDPRGRRLPLLRLAMTVPLDVLADLVDVAAEAIAVATADE